MKLSKYSVNHNDNSARNNLMTVKLKYVLLIVSIVLNVIPEAGVFNHTIAA